MAGFEEQYHETEEEYWRGLSNHQENQIVELTQEKKQHLLTLEKQYNAAPFNSEEKAELERQLMAETEGLWSHEELGEWNVPCLCYECLSYGDPIEDDEAPQ